MKIKILAFIAVVAMSVSGPASAKAMYMTDGELLPLCLDLDRPMNTMFCQMYLVGVADSHDGMNSWGRVSEPKFCKPGHIVAPQLMDVYVLYSSSTKGDPAAAAVSVVLNAFSIAWPCE